MTNIPTADEFFDNLLIKHGATFSDIESDQLYDDIINRAIEFAKLHKNVALEVVAKDIHGIVSVNWDYEIDIDKDSILSAYPDENIK